LREVERGERGEKSREKREERREKREEQREKRESEKARTIRIFGRIIPRFVQHTGELTTQSTPIAGQKY
jgi:hypothetical protein